MRELTFERPGELRWRERDEPALQGPGEALVRPVAASNCDLDTAIVRGRAPFGGPFAIGHEFVAEVVDCAPDVTAITQGELVIVPWKISCGECRYCARGLTAHCESVPPLAMYGLPLGGEWGCGVSDQVRVPYAEHMLMAVPPGLEPATVVAASDNLPDAWRCVASPLDEHPGAEVLIVGGGTRATGLYAAGIALALGAGRVHYLDRDPSRLQVAERYGAQAIECTAPPRSAGAYPVTVDASATPAGLACALRSTGPGGVCTSTGIYFEDAPVPLLDMYRNGVTLRTGVTHTRASAPQVLELIAQRRFDPGPVLAEVVDWEDAPAAYARLSTKTVLVRE